jgi:hypothetical protein
MPLTATPAPDTFTAVVPVRLVPVIVTGTAVPCKPEEGEIEASVGPCTVNVTVLLVAPFVVVVTFLEVRPAPGAIVKVAVI